MNRNRKIKITMLLAAFFTLLPALLFADTDLTLGLDSLLAAGVTMAAIRIKPIENLKRKYAQNAGGASASYEEGVNFPRRSQSEAAVAAADTYAQAVQEAIGEGRFAAGVREAGDEKWKRNALAKGKGRYPQGVQAGQDDWAKNTAPILAAIAALDLPPRGVKGSETNFNRVRQVAQAAQAAARR